MALAKETCDHIKKPKLKVNIDLEIPEATYDYTKSSQDLTKDQYKNTVDWLKEQGIKSAGVAEHLGKFIAIRGVASGGYAYKLSYKMQAKHVDRYGVYYCPYLTEVNLNLIYSSRIFIANEIPRKSCEFEEVMKHEWKHHTANVMAVKTYSDRLKKDLPVIARDIELRFGYIDESKVPYIFDQIKLSVKDMIEIYYDSIYRESKNRNATIDTSDEYNRVDNAIKMCEKEKGVSKGNFP